MLNRGVASLKWRLAFLSIVLFVVFMRNSQSGGHAGGHLSRRLLQEENTTLQPELDNVEEEEIDVVDLCAETNASDNALFPQELFTDEQLGQGAVCLHVLGILYMFYALALVCDHFFVPSLDIIIEKFGISPDVAGATLMAAGGSAPELFTSIIGVFIAVSDVGIGTIVGSAVFNVLFVIAACAFASADALSLTAWPLVRDTAFYSIALMLLVGFFVDDKIHWYEALILFLWYGAYVTFMKFNVYAENKFLAIFPSLKKKEEEDAEDLNTTAMELKAGFKYNPYRRPLLEIMQGKVTDSPVPIVTEMKDMKSGIQGLKKQLEGGEEKGDGEETEKLTGGTGDDDKDTNAKDVEKDAAGGGDDEKKDAEGGEDNEPYRDVVMSGPTGSLVSKIAWFITMPLMIPMWITTPDPNNPSRKKFFYITFIMSILWIMVFSYLMVWWATTTGRIIGISDAVMGLTFLAAGTSVPDLITSVLVAKQGHGDMAVSSSIGSNIFDVTVGLPVPWLLYTIINQTHMPVSSVGMACNIGMLFLMLMLVIASIIVFKWKMTKAMGGIMLCLYAVFVVVSLGLSSCWFVCFI